MSMEKAQLAEHVQAISDLSGLEEHPGWKLVTAKYREKIKTIEATIWTAATDAKEAESLRQIRIKLEEDYSPDALISGLLNMHRNRATNLKKKIDLKP